MTCIELMRLDFSADHDGEDRRRCDMRQHAIVWTL